VFCQINYLGKCLRLKENPKEPIRNGVLKVETVNGESTSMDALSDAASAKNCN